MAPALKLLPTLFLLFVHLPPTARLLAEEAKSSPKQAVVAHKATDSMEYSDSDEDAGDGRKESDVPMKVDEEEKKSSEEDSKGA